MVVKQKTKPIRWIPTYQQFFLPNKSILYWNEYDGGMLVFANSNKQGFIPVVDLMKFLKEYLCD